ncbi:MAG: hypothetical protein JRH06_12475 [Deltaproteobacteria bacterium]|nr:hypothetical protein [Deltaproteobacteria bacterium]
MKNPEGTLIGSKKSLTGGKIAVSLLGYNSEKSLLIHHDGHHEGGK